MIRLRVAGGLVASQWVPARVDRVGNLHCVVEASRWDGSGVDGAQDIIVDVDMEAVMLEFPEVLHRLVNRRHAEMSDEENQEMHEAIDKWVEEQKKSRSGHQTATSGGKDTDTGKSSTAGGRSHQTPPSSGSKSKGS